MNFMPNGDARTFRSRNQNTIPCIAILWVRCNARNVGTSWKSDAEAAELEMIVQKCAIEYHGFDFSQIAVKNTAQRLGKSGVVFVGNALEPEAYSSYDYDCIVCTEVLEHIEQDISAVKLWKPGTFCICTVPNFDYSTHVRFFQNRKKSAKGTVVLSQSIRSCGPQSLCSGMMFREYSEICGGLATIPRGSWASWGSTSSSGMPGGSYFPAFA